MKLCLALAALSYIAVANAQQLYRTIQLVPDGSDRNISVANAINNAGQALGYFISSAGQADLFLWQNGAFTIIAGPNGANITGNASALNSFGVVGGSLNGNTPFTWQNNVFRYLPATVGRFSAAEVYGINDQGVAVGIYTDGSTQSTQATLWQNSAVTPTPLQGYVCDPASGSNCTTWAYGINNNGQIIIDRATPVEGGAYNLYDKAVVLQGSTATDLGVLPGGNSTFARAINNLGQVVGGSGFCCSSNTSKHAFVWMNGNMIDLTPSLAAGQYSEALGISQGGGFIVGQAAGNGYPLFGTAVLFSGNSMVDLNTLLATPLADPLQAATAVNDSGQITALLISLSSHLPSAYLLDPLPLTPTGSNVSGAIADPTTGQTDGSLTFATVTQAGCSTILSTTPDPSAPVGFELSGGSGNTYYYNIQTSATYSGTLTVCLNTAGLTLDPPAPPALYHFENGQWNDVTTSVTATQVCGQVTSLSPFAITRKVILASMNVVNNINLSGGGETQVRILGKPNFNAVNSINTSSLTFGHTGTEQSLIACSPSQNAAGTTDLLCRFDTVKANFQAGDIYGRLRGRTTTAPALDVRSFAPITIKP